MKEQKFISKKWFILLAIGLLLIPVIAYAQGFGGLDAAGAAASDAGAAAAKAASAGAAKATTAGLFDDVFKTVAGILTQLMKAFQKLLWPIMLAIGGLLGNDLLYGAGMEQRLLEVWTQIRNFVNIAFVVLLLGVALYNVIGFGKSENYILKTALPKIIIALIAVNFSYIGIKVILDVTNVLTIAVFTLPTSVSEDLQSTEIVKQKFNTDGTPVLKDGKAEYTVDKTLEAKICKSMFGTTTEFADRIKSQKNNEELYCHNPGTNRLEFTQKGKEFFAQYSPRNASLILAIQLMNVVEVDKITEASAAGFDLQKLSFTLLFSVIIYLLYAVAYAVLFVILLVRMVVLWVFIALSPVIAISIGFPDLLSKAGSSFDFKEKFIKHAIAPIMVAVPMTLGYIMLDALKHVKTGQIRNDFQLGALDINTAGISDLQSMMVAFGAVAVVWVGVFAAAEGTYAADLVGRIQGKLREAGSTAANAVKYIPLIPAGAGTKGRISYTQASKLWRAPLDQLKAKYGGETEKTLTTHEVNKIRTASAARAALGRKGLNNAAVQRALAKKIQSLNKSSVTGGKQLNRDVTRKLGKGGWRKFEQGKLSGQKFRNLKSLGGAPATSTARSTGGTAGVGAGSGTAGTVATAATAANVDIDESMTYASTNGIDDDPQLKAKYSAWQQAKNPKAKKKAAATLRSDGTFQNIVNAKNKAGGSLNAVTNSTRVVSNAPSAAQIPKDKLEDLEAKVKAADTELQTKAGITDLAERKKILKGIVKKSLGTNYDAFIKNNPKAGGIKSQIE